MDPIPHPFTLRQLQYAIAVADELSFRRAAERCHVSQPALSTQLAQLEDALGDPFVLAAPQGHPLARKSTPAATAESARRRCALARRGTLFSGPGARGV